MRMCSLDQTTSLPCRFLFQGDGKPVAVESDSSYGGSIYSNPRSSFDKSLPSSYQKEQSMPNGYQYHQVPSNRLREDAGFKDSPNSHSVSPSQNVPPPIRLDKHPSFEARSPPVMSPVPVAHCSSLSGTFDREAERLHPDDPGRNAIAEEIKGPRSPATRHPPTISLQETQRRYFVFHESVELRNCGSLPTNKEASKRGGQVENFPQAIKPEEFVDYEPNYENMENVKDRRRNSENVTSGEGRRASFRSRGCSTDKEEVQLKEKSSTPPTTNMHFAYAECHTHSPNSPSIPPQIPVVCDTPTT